MDADAEQDNNVDEIATRYGAEVVHDKGDYTVTVERDRLHKFLFVLQQNPSTRFEQLIDLCGVDYLEYGREGDQPWKGARYAVVYHLLSVSRNERLRVVTWLEDERPVVESVRDIWRSADWFEREAFDLFGIIFDGHPDLRRILTDYGFIGHPFRKDFPLSGHVEMRYDQEKKRVVYEPVSIEPRITVPRVIREEGYGDRDT